MLPEDPEGDDSHPSDTALTKHLRRVMQIRGALTMAQYMREGLLNAKHGYYTQSSRPVFGVRGDFITAPEISQVFGELLGFWALQCHQQVASKGTRMNVVELGPGRGTLCHDVLRTIANSHSLNGELELHLVEASPALQKKQAQKLLCKEEDIANMHADGIDDGERDLRLQQGATTPEGVRVRWYRNLGLVQPSGPVQLIAQELFDALPVHVLEYTDKGWREVLVDVDPKRESGYAFKHVLSPGPTVASRTLEKNRVAVPIENQDLPDVGTRLEVCLDGMALAQDIASLVAKNTGSAIIIDYGEDFALQDSIRAIREHKYEHIFERPGDADLSAYVDFSALKSCLRAMPEEMRVHVHGPVTQANLLRELGIEPRMVSLLANAGEDNEKAEPLISGYERLVEGDEMGTIYKALAMTSAPGPMYGFP